MPIPEVRAQPSTGAGSPPPEHVAIIMDGNGRWASARGLPRVAGHRAGAQAVRRTVEAAIATGVGWLNFYAFSSENWRRPAAEVLDLTGLLRHYIRQELAEMSREGVRVRVIGDRDRFDAETRAELVRAEGATKGNTRLNLNVALSYGGSRDEMVRAARAAAEAVAAGRLSPEDLDEAMLERFLFTAGMPDPDLVIRTSGERRLSNFLLWQSAYSELVFLDVLWPDFGRADFDVALVSSPGVSAASVPALADPLPAGPAAASSKGSRWGDLGKRAASASLMAPVAIGCIWFGGAPWLLLMLLAAIGLSLEWVWLCARQPSAWPGVAVPVVVALGTASAGLDRLSLGLAVLVAGAAALGLLARRSPLALGILYMGVASACLVWLRDGQAATGRANVLFLMLVVWASDIGAYVFGRLVGGKKLAPSLSPGKTWSGALGGLATAMLVGAIAAQALEPGSGVRAAVLAGVLGVVSQAGDLLESGIKRGFGVKDSGG